MSYYNFFTSFLSHRMFNKDIADTQFKNPALLVKCVARRRAGFFLYNIILILVRSKIYKTVYLPQKYFSEIVHGSWYVKIVSGLLKQVKIAWEISVENMPSTVSIILSKGFVLYRDMNKSCIRC